MNPGPEGNAGLTYRIIGLAMRVHRNLGPGLLESAYHRCLAHELTKASIPFAQHVPLMIRYDDVDIGSGYVADMIVDEQVILEIKAVERLAALHEAQLLTYLRASGCRVGLLMNFNTISVTDGIRRRVV